MITKIGKDLSLLNDMPEEHQIPYMLAAYKDIASKPKKGWKETLRLPMIGIGGLGAISGAISSASKWTPQAYIRRPAYAIAGGIGGAVGGAGIGAVLGAIKKIKEDGDIDDAKKVLRRQQDPIALAERVALLRSKNRAAEKMDERVYSLLANPPVHAQRNWAGY